MTALLNFILFLARHLEAGNLKSAVKFIMIMLYMPSEMAGYQTLIIAIPIFCDDREQSMTKELYPKIGRRLGVTWKKIEKDIRGVIKKGWERRNEEIWWAIFPQHHTPSNRVFIARIADVLDLWQMLEKVEKTKAQ